MGRLVPVNAIVDGAYIEIGLGRLDERAQCISMTFNDEMLEKLNKPEPKKDTRVHIDPPRQGPAIVPVFIPRPANADSYRS